MYSEGAGKKTAYPRELEGEHGEPVIKMMAENRGHQGLGKGN